MGKTNETFREFCARIIRENPGTFRTDNSILFCSYCEHALPGASKTSHVKQHINSEKHKKKVDERNNPSTSGSSARQTLLVEHQQPRPELKINELSMDLCKTFMEANIPLKKTSHPSVVKFHGKYTGKTMPSESTLRQKYVPILYDECMKNLRKKVQENYIWVSIDETTDVENRLVCNFIFGILCKDENNSEQGKCYLLNMDVVEIANTSSMAAFFNNSLLLLWPNSRKLFS